MWFISTADAVPVNVRNGPADELLELCASYMGWKRGGSGDKSFCALSVRIVGMTADLREGRTSPTTFFALFQRRMGLLLGELDTHHRVEDDH